MLIRRIPKIIHTGQTEAINPLILGSAISPRYIGTAVNESPSVIPAINLAMNINVDDVAQAINNQDNMKGAAEKMISFFLPKMSTIIPVNKAPKIAPSSGVTTNQELSSLVMVKV